jgi:hypothetical protein
MADVLFLCVGAPSHPFVDPRSAKSVVGSVEIIAAKDCSRANRSWGRHGMVLCDTRHAGSSQSD